jgi:hypothetical protein
MYSFLQPLAAGKVLARVIGWGLVLFLLLGVHTAARAQDLLLPKAPPDLTADQSLEVLGSYDLADMGDAWWKAVAGDVQRTLTTPGASPALAMRKVIYLSTFYPGQVRFDRCGSALYDVYRFDGSQPHRVLALTALSVMGYDPAMRKLTAYAPFALYAPWEDAPMVRHLTEAAVLAYYVTPHVVVEPPVILRTE